MMQIITIIVIIIIIIIINSEIKITLLLYTSNNINFCITSVIQDMIKPCEHFEYRYTGSLTSYFRVCFMETNCTLEMFLFLYDI